MKGDYIMRKMYSKKQIEEIAKSSGTKLYKHILYNSGLDYKFILITTNPQPIDFLTIDTFDKLYNYLLTQNIIRFTDAAGDIIQYESNTDNYFYTVISQGAAPSISLYDDWGLLETTDTVSPL